ncbi:MAG: methyltransferase domain-containing protein [Puniceicoccales bacterium]|jgi:hypothetical protein|nr:methyltransferase domain-containing protein [Puniceicoccales bacterium]
MLAAGKKGLGFGCGEEPLSSLFASYGCEILATDLDMNDQNAKSWLNGQNAQNNVKNINKLGICPSKQFDELVNFMPVDMNNIPEELYGQFDFNWSSCALEHIGGMEKSMQFLINNLKTLKSGGISIHTSEFNLSSENDTCFDPNCFIFRKQDIEKVISKLQQLGHEVFPMNFKIGNYVADNYVDIPPYRSDVHLRLEIQKFVSTSFGLIVRKH